MRSPEEIIDSASLRMAHPHRAVFAMGLQGFEDFYRILPPEESKFLLDLFAGTRSLPQIQGMLLSDRRALRLREIMEFANAAPSATGSGGSAPMFAAMRQAYAPAPYFLVEDDLLELLDHTDISEDVPVGHLHMPFARVVIEFGKKRAGLPGVPNATTGMHVLESAYLELADDEEMGRHLSVLFIGSPVGHDNIGDDATLNMALPMENLERPLADAHAAAFELMAEASRNAGYNEPPREWEVATKELMRLLVKVLLYIGLPGIRKEVHNERAEVLQQMERLKSPAKRAKLQRRLAKTSDYVVIKAPAETPHSSESSDGTRTVKTHWRRGHLRTQRHGPQLTLSKTVFIAPVLVGMGDSHPAPHYVVR